MSDFFRGCFADYLLDWEMINVEIDDGIRYRTNIPTGRVAFCQLIDLGRIQAKLLAIGEIYEFDIS